MLSLFRKYQTLIFFKTNLQEYNRSYQKNTRQWGHSFILRFETWNKNDEKLQWKSNKEDYSDY